MYTKYLTQHITIDYEYFSDPYSSPSVRSTSLYAALAILPPLIVKKMASTTYAHFYRPFEYDIKFINPCNYPMYIYFFDHLLADTMYQPCSFVVDHRCSMGPTYLNDWVYLGILPPHTECVVSYTAKVTPPLCNARIISQVDALYFFVLPNPLVQFNWFETKSNLCCI